MIIQAFTEPRAGGLTEAELDASIEPWHLPAHVRQIEAERARSPAPRIPRIPHGCDQQGRYPMQFQPQAAEPVTHFCHTDDDAKSIADIVMDWLTPSRFWALYVLTFVGAMLGVWVVLS